ncbi:MAG: DivIVA domain-containing protein [Actinobacteria bacterium]|nr:DivIVA domain-containing protein [Actinomycetota bacterium]MCG2802640.1 DivIVA domain-containing protein [Cellulomonas sp.]
MALLTADDVLNKKFQATKFRDGYDQDEVDDFLDEVVTTLNELQTENDELTNKLAAAERRIAELSRGGGADIVAEPVAISAPEPVFAPPVPATPEPVVAPVAASEPESATGMLALAQKLHDDYVRSGQTEGERVVSEARSRAEQIVHEAEETSSRTLAQLEQERSLLERKIDELRVFERDYRTRLKSYLENLLGDLDNRGNALPPRSAGQDLPSL